MKALFKILFLGVLATGLLIACAKSGGDGAAANPYGYNPNGYNGYGVAPYPYSYQGISQIQSPDLYMKYLTGQFCMKIFGSNYLCRQIDNAPGLEIQLSDLTFSTMYTRAQLTINVRPNQGWSINGTQFPKENITLNLYRIANNTRFEGVSVDRVSGNGFGGRLSLQGTLPAANGVGPMTVDMLYDGQPMLHATLTRYR